MGVCINMTTVIDVPAISRLSRDLIKASTDLQPSEVRYLVDMYYSMQDYRIQAQGQIRASNEDGEPHELIRWQFKQMEAYEESVKRALEDHTDREPVGVWLKSIYGIGPVIAAGLIAHIDITQAPTVGHIWSFAGLNPTQEWGKGQKRPWNAKLKTLCWKIGQSFMKFSGREDCYYGKLYKQRKQYEIDKNEAGEYAEQAALALSRKKFRDDTKAKAIYETGKLPPAHLDARARRWTVKLFLAHLHGEMYRQHFGTEPPLPYPIAHLGHAHLIKPAT